MARLHDGLTLFLVFTFTIFRYTIFLLSFYFKGARVKDRGGVSIYGKDAWSDYLLAGTPITLSYPVRVIKLLGRFVTLTGPVKIKSVLGQEGYLDASHLRVGTYKAELNLPEEFYHPPTIFTIHKDETTHLTMTVYFLTTLSLIVNANGFYGMEAKDPNLMSNRMDAVFIVVKNADKEEHGFAVTNDNEVLFNSATRIAPNEEVTIHFIPNAAGEFAYVDVTNPSNGGKFVVRDVATFGFRRGRFLGN